jgi:hypothetical protein
MTGDISSAAPFDSSSRQIVRLDDNLAIWIGKYRPKGHVAILGSIVAQLNSSPETFVIVGS